MNTCRCLLFLLLSASGPLALADTSAGIFAILDEVTLEPSELNPERVRLKGAFVIPQPISSGLHLAPRQGELYFSVNPEFADETRSDWKALAAAAGTGQVVAFAEYWAQIDPGSMLRQMPENLRRSMKSSGSSYNTSLVVTLHTDAAPAEPETYPRPNRLGVITSFDADYQLCPRFGASSSEIIASLWQAHDPELARPELPGCAATED